MYILFAGAIISALLSTIDSCLLVSATLVANNFWRLRPDADDRERIRWTRTWVVILGLSAYAITFTSERVFDLSQEASSLGASGLFTVVFFALFTKFGGPWSASAAIVSGLSLYLVGDKILDWQAAFLTSLVMSGVIYVLVASLEHAIGRPGKALPIPSQGSSA
jgi:Na+/proline symporter